MSAYTDITLLNCNRAASVEARTNNNTNPAVFTNPLQQTVRLDVGDQISLERSFISEIGAGNPSTIEFKGQNNGVNAIASYTDIQYGDYNYTKDTTYNPNYRLGYYRSIITTIKSDDTCELRDNLAPLLIGFYITSSEYPNYIQQPRRYLQDARYGIRSQQINPYLLNNQWEGDDGSQEGSAFHSVNPDIYVNSDWKKRNRNGDDPSVAGKIYQQRVDNNRYTLFIKDYIVYDADVEDEDGDKIAVKQMPTSNIDGIFSECNYLRVREKLPIDISKGFNTPSDVSNQITQQLTKTTEPEPFEIIDTNGDLQTITHTVQSPTYKPINSHNFYNCNLATSVGYMATVIGADPNQNAVDYIATFGYIGVKRPEIWEAGRIMGDYIVPNTPLLNNLVDDVVTPATTLFTNGFDGFQVALAIANTLVPTNIQYDIVLNVRWSETNLRYIRDLLDTQAYYPELWDNLENSVSYKKSELPLVDSEVPTLANSRFFHINKYDIQTQFGDDGFIITPDPIGANESYGSEAVFFKWNEDSRNSYFEATDILGGGNRPLSYGFAYPHKFENWSVVDGENVKEIVYLVVIQTYNRGGIPRTLFTTEVMNEDDPPVAIATEISIGRRIGFDYHATAYSTAVITPNSGYSNGDIGTATQHLNKAGAAGNFQVLSETSEFLDETNLMPYQTQTYIGANNPSCDFNTITNRFEFQRFHTANNVGNLLMAGSQAASIINYTMTPTGSDGAAGTITSTGSRVMIPPPINADAGDTVYKISPRPPQLGYSPTFKPYKLKHEGLQSVPYPNGADDVEDSALGLNTNFYSQPSQTIEPFEIFDAHGGIYIDNWGVSEADWDNNLWNILGFSYSQLNQQPTASNVLTKRVNNDNLSSLYRLTTNAEIVATDTKAYIANNYGANMYYTSLPYPKNILQYNPKITEPASTHYMFQANVAAEASLVYYPEIVMKTQSVAVQADGLSKSVLKPYYTIRSSILEGSTAIGGNPTGANLPIISIVDKYSAQGDYFFGSPSNLTFTITKPQIVSNITTSIHDPDGTYSNINETSAVIYKISKLKKGAEDIVSQILKKEKKK